MKKSIIVAKREYLKVVKKPSFWLSTSFFPVFIVVISLISGFSSAQLESKLKSESENAKTILIIDESNLINQSVYNSKIVKETDLNLAIDKVVKEEVDVAIYYSKDLVENKEIKVFSQDKGLFLNESYNSFALNLLKQSILLKLDNPNDLTAYNNEYSYSVKSYKKGLEVNFSLSNLIIPGISLVIYFVLTTFAVSYLLLSVSEEKENRVMEIVLSTLSPKNLIIGKIIGLIGVIITQVLVLIVLSIVGIILSAQLFSSNANLISTVTQAFSDLGSDPLKLIQQILLGVIFTFSGFFILACTMVGVGAVTPTYKEAQSLSSVFIMVSIFPVYFITMIISDPAGDLAKVLSFFPYTSSFVLLFRNALGALSTAEVILGIFLLLLYCLISIYLAFKLFEIGALEYSKKVSVKNLKGVLKR